MRITKSAGLATATFPAKATNYVLGTAVLISDDIKFLRLRAP